MKRQLSHYEKILKAAPDHLNAHVNYANTLNLLGRHADALESYNQIIRLIPNSAAAYANRAYTLKQLKRLDDGGRRLRQGNFAGAWLRRKRISTAAPRCTNKSALMRRCRAIRQPFNSSPALRRRISTAVSRCMSCGASMPRSRATTRPSKSGRNMPRPISIAARLCMS